MSPGARAPVVAVAAVVFDDAGHVLLIERGRPPGVGLWTVPGGRVEAGETLIAAVAREVQEETGLAVTVGPLVQVVERIANDGAYHYVILDYLAAVRLGTSTAPHAADDARAARWVKADELPQMELTDGLIPVIEAARALGLVVANAAAPR